MNKKKLLIGLFTIVFISSFLYGLAVPIYKLPPYETLNLIHDIVNKQNYDTVSSYSYPQVNIDSLIQINSQSDIALARSNLVQYIWKQNEFPHNELPTQVITNLTDQNYYDLQNLSKMDKIITIMNYGVDSNAYLFLAKNSNSKLVIYHQGHDGDFILGKKTIQFFLSHDYSVLAFSMPLVGSNSHPVVELPNLGTIKLQTHDDLRFLETDQFSPIKYFVHPIALSLNYLEKNYDFDSYYMVGISGGGWTTAFYSALDDRITKSYPVAGTAPMYLRFGNPQNMGDYEQMHLDVYNIAEYLDQYIMASYGDGREQLQIFNKHDPCCFSGTAFVTYENKIKERLSILGRGNFSVFIDEENKDHSISNKSLEVILQNMQN